MAANDSIKIQKKPYFPYFSMHLAMQYMNLMVFGIIESKYCTEKFKMTIKRQTMS